MEYKRPNVIVYRIAQIASWFVATLIFKRKFIRNEIKGKRGPFVVIANHECAFDFVNLIGATAHPMSFVISRSFFNTLPIKGFLRKMGVIPKQQFQTTVRDLKKMQAVIEQGEPLVIYPAGLMCEDGLSTPIPAATYKFLKWLDADIYVARSIGTYFVMPKWSNRIRPGRTYLDIYQLFSKEELADIDLATLKQKTDDALLFDAYREQEDHLVKYKNNQHIDGIENVLYMCPRCMAEFSTGIKDGHTIYCNKCGFEQVSDEYGFFHNHRGIGEELRHVSEWSRRIYQNLKHKIQQGKETTLTAKTKLHMIDPKKNRFAEVGSGTVTLSQEQFLIDGQICGKAISLPVSIANIPSLPFSPGRYLEIQHGSDIYRCVLEDGRLVMKFINMVKIFYDLAHTETSSVSLGY